MKYLLLVMLVASIAGVEFFHELWSGDATGASICRAPETNQDEMREMLLHHLKSH